MNPAFEPLRDADRVRRGVWVTAAVVTLLLHLGVAWVAVAFKVFDPSELAPEEREPIKVVFPRERPKLFTELPDDRADEPPENADLLSNVDSRARDRTPGGEADAMPRMEGRSEFPQVRIDPGEPDFAPPSDQLVEKEEEADARDLVQKNPDPPQAPRSKILGSLAREQLARRQALSRPRPTGLSDILQEEMSHEKGNAVLSGDISLSTTEWDFAPWLKSFRRAVLRRWRAPAAYHMGLIDGWTEIELEVLRDGTVRRTDVVAQDVGHRSLTTSAVIALDGAAPYRALPDHFPDETLIVQIRFVYPRLRP